MPPDQDLGHLHPVFASLAVGRLIRLLNKLQGLCLPRFASDGRRELPTVSPAEVDRSSAAGDTGILDSEAGTGQTGLRDSDGTQRGRGAGGLGQNAITRAHDTPPPTGRSLRPRETAARVQAEI